jgi:hypothetical protein
MGTPEFILKDKVEIFGKIYNHICYLMATEEWTTLEGVSIDLMEILGYEITEEERKYLMEYPNKYLESFGKEDQNEKS